MHNDDLKIDWIDFFRFIWSKKILIIIVISLGLVVGVYKASEEIETYTIKIPYSDITHWDKKDILTVSQGEWRVRSTANTALEVTKRKDLKDSGIIGFFIHETSQPKEISEYILELNKISKSLANIQYKKQLLTMKTFNTFSDEVKSTELFARTIAAITLYESGVVDSFQLHHPEFFPFIIKGVGIVRDKTETLKTIVFYIFIALFILSFYLFIGYLTKNK